MEPWRRVWREGFAPLLPLDGLRALAGELRRPHGQRLCQGQVVASRDPYEEQPSRACAVGFCVWQGYGLTGRQEVVDYFDRAALEVNNRLGTPEDSSACRWFLNWFDETDLTEVRRELLPEVELELRRRREAVA